MLVVPIVIFLATIPVSRRMKPRLCLLYRVAGGIVVFAGSATSLYFAAYTGDQGGIAAYFFQIAVILVYALFSVILVTTNWLLQQRDMRKHES